MRDYLKEQNESFNAAINFALEESKREAPSAGILFLEMWREGNWSSIKKEFSEFDMTKLPKPERYSKKKNILDFFKIIEGEIIQEMHYKLSVFYFEKLAYLIHKRIDISMLDKEIINRLPIESGKYLGKAREVALWRSKSNASNVNWSSKEDNLTFELQNLMELD